MQLKEASKDVKLHNIKCYNIQARGIKSLAYCRELKKLAVLRTDFSIEIWNFTGAPFIERVISGSIDCALEQICWAGERLFSVSISGDGLIEYDLQTLMKKRNLLLTGEKGICIDYHKKTERLAIGTEEGFINIFDVSDDDIQFVKLLDRQDHRVVCCKFNGDGNHLVSGSIDAVKVWSLRTGHVIHKMSTGRSEQNQETIVWCLEVLKDFTILTGDSRGRVTFWDGNLGSQIDWVQASKFDIMCLTLSDDGNAYYCSGLEQIVRKYVRIKTSRDGNDMDQWIRTARRFKLHTHDILSVVRIDDRIVTAGIDGFLSISSDDLKILERIGPFLKHPFSSVAEDSRMILMRYANYLELWKLATAKQEIDDKNATETEMDEEDEPEKVTPVVVSSTNKNNYYKLQRYPEKYLELRSKEDEMITCSAISNNGKWMSYSTASSIRFFHFEEIEGSKPHLMRVKNIPNELTNCTLMTFTHDSSTFITINGSICTVFDLTSDLIEHRQTIELNEWHKDLINLVTISNCSKYLVFSSLCNTVSVWMLRKNKFVYGNTLPKYTHPVTSMKIRPNCPELVIAYSDNNIIEYNLNEFFIQFRMVLTETRCAVQDLCLDSRNPDVIIFAHNNVINVVRKGAEIEELGRSNKKVKISNIKKDFEYSIKAIKKLDDHLIHMNWMLKDELLAIEMNPVSLTENLPAPLRRKLFGAM